MDFNIFLSLTSSDNEERTRAIKFAEELSKDPSIILTLIDFIQNNNFENQQLFEIVQLFILDLIRSHWALFDETIETFYWSPEQQHEISYRLLDALLKLKYENRKHIVECFRHIVIKSFPLNVEFAQKIMEIYDSCTNSVEDFETILKIIVFWAKACALRTIPDDLSNVIEEINLNYVKRFIKVVENINLRITRIMILITKSLRGFLKKMHQILLCPKFDQLLLFLVQQLFINDINDNDLMALKRCILKFFIVLNKEFFSSEIVDENDVRFEYSKHFKQNIAPSLLNAIISLMAFENDRITLYSCTYILYQYVFYSIGDLNFVTPGFMKNIIIPLAKLTKQDLEEIISSPLQFLEFNYSFDYYDSYISRTSVSLFLGEILEKLKNDDNFLNELYDYLLEQTVDQFDFESRIYLMTKYVIATMTNLGPMIEPEVVTLLGNEALKVDQHPSFVITSLLMFMSSVLPYLDPEEGCKLAMKCIYQTDEPIIICAASKLLRHSIIECDSRFDIPISEVVPKLLMTASEIRYEYLSTAVEALIQIGGKSIYPFVSDTIAGLFNICKQSLTEDDSKNASSMLYSIFEIVNAIPDDEPILIELSESSLPECISLLKEYPNNHCFNDIFLLISVFNTKIDQVTETMIKCYISALEIIQSDEVLMTSMQEICYFMCPIILSDIFPTNQELINQTIEICKTFLQYTSQEEDYDGHAYAILIVASLIQSIGQPSLIFLPNIFESLTLVKDPSSVILFSSCVVAIASALMIQNLESSVFNSIPRAFIDFIIQKTTPSTLQTYKEMKLGFILLLKCIINDRIDAYPIAVNLLPALCERKIEYEMNINDKMLTAKQLENENSNAEFPPLIIPFVLPSDKFDEYQLFGNISSNRSLYNMLSNEQKNIIHQIFQ